ncbi:unnamed protein product, partial [Discosporangium mesarthrocarpum]
MLQRNSGFVGTLGAGSEAAAVAGEEVGPTKAVNVGKEIGEQPGREAAAGEGRKGADGLGKGREQADGNGVTTRSSVKEVDFGSAPPNIASARGVSAGMGSGTETEQVGKGGHEGHAASRREDEPPEGENIT